MTPIASILRPSPPDHADSNDFESVKSSMKAARRFGSPKNPIPGHGGFTMVELLAVMVMMAILAIVLLPALAGTKSDPRAFQCLNNQRQLILGWQMYAADNNDLLTANDYPFLTAYRGASPTTQLQMRNWVVGTMAISLDANGAFAPCIAELSDPNTELSPYVKNYKVYHCPADNYINHLTDNLNLRSYSMNAAVGTCNWTHYNAPNYPLGSAVGEGWLLGASYSSAETGPWLTYGKLSSFTRPGPANTFVIMDENPLSINDGALDISAVATPGNTYIIDYPSGLHGAAGVISFADGHVIIHKWLDSRTYSPMKQSQQGGAPGGGAITSHAG
jgi:prepilin-type N-terminal cleavage/methylation domain-containing protein/prepilin-type processing-associated H-X9-DG protein